MRRPFPLVRIAFIILVTLTAHQAHAQIDAEQVINIGRNVLSMDDYMLSIQYFNQAIKAKPYLAEPYYLRAVAKLSLEDFKGAEEDCSLAIERNKFRPDSYKLRGFARQSQGKDSLAVEDYNVGLRYNPQDKYFLFYKAVALTELDRLAEADSTFSTLLRLYPRMDEAYSARARLRTIQTDTIGALCDLEKAITLSGTSVQPFLVRANINANRRNWQEALDDMDKAINLQPHQADFYVNRAFIRYNLDDFFGAMSDYNYTLELEPYNMSALFNRALLRYEVKDLDRAADDLAAVLRLDNDNFHARYNLGLIDLERGKNREALDQFNLIAAKYPKFYPVYYARAEAYRNLNNMRAAMQNVHHADELVRGYVTNPEKNALDRPTIQPGEANDRTASHDNENEEQTMERFNQLVTVSNTEETPLAFNDRIKGRVQDRDVTVETQQSFLLSFTDSPHSLKSTSNYFRDLDTFNASRYISYPLYLTPGSGVADGNYDSIFSIANQFEAAANSAESRPADWLALGVARTMLRDYDAAILALDEAIRRLPQFTMAYLQRAYAKSASDDILRMKSALADYDKVLSLAPTLIYAHFNKGNIYYAMGDYTSALQSYSDAIVIDPTFAPAIYNRGLTYLRMGNRRQAFADLSKAGELGVLQSYNLLKRMK